MKANTISLMGYFGHSNTGDDAILTCLIDQLRRMALGEKIVLFTAAPQSCVKTHRVTAVPNIIPSSFHKLLIGVLGRNRTTFLRALRTFVNSRVLIVGGGGLLHDRPSTSEYLLDLLYKIAWAKRLGQMVILLGVGVGPIHLEKSKKVLKAVLNKVDLITVRDGNSRRLLDQLGVRVPEIETTADFAFLMQPDSPDRITEICNIERISTSRNTRIAICLCGRDASIVGLRRGVTSFCRYAIEKLNARIWFVPMQIGGGEDDREGARSIMGELKSEDRIFLIDQMYGPAEIMGILSNMDVVVGEKLHSIIFCINNAVPFIGISYSPKVEALFQEMNRAEWCVGLHEMDKDSIVTRFEPLWAERDSVKLELKLVSERLRKKALLNFDILNQKLKSIKF